MGVASERDNIIIRCFWVGQHDVSIVLHLLLLLLLLLFRRMVITVLEAPSLHCTVLCESNRDILGILGILGYTGMY